MAIGIQGIDESIFNDLLDGDEDLFVTVLETFINKTPEALSKLPPITKESLPDYAIRIHGIKGACANICAEEARQKAFKLEQMSRAGDLNGVLADHEPFMKHMEELMGRLKDWYNGHK